MTKKYKSGDIGRTTIIAGGMTRKDQEIFADASKKQGSAAQVLTILEAASLRFSN